MKYSKADYSDALALHVSVRFEGQEGNMWLHSNEYTAGELPIRKSPIASLEIVTPRGLTKQEALQVFASSDPSEQNGHETGLRFLDTLLNQKRPSIDFKITFDDPDAQPSPPRPSPPMAPPTAPTDAEVTPKQITLAGLAAYRGRPDIIQRICEGRSGCLDGALHLAAQAGHLACVRELIHLGCDIHACDDDGNSPLQLAAIHDRVDICRELLAHGANHFGWSIHCKKGSPRSIKLKPHLDSWNEDSRCCYIYRRGKGEYQIPPCTRNRLGTLPVDINQMINEFVSGAKEPWARVNMAITRANIDY